MEIAGGFGPLAGKVFRIGTMGYGSTAENVQLILEALADAHRRTRLDRLLWPGLVGQASWLFDAVRGKLAVARESRTGREACRTTFARIMESSC